MAMIRAVLLDVAVVFDRDSLQAGAEKCLVRLRYSSMLLGIASASSFSPNQLEVLEKLGISDNLKLFVADGRKLNQRVTSEWDIPDNSCLFVCTEKTSDLWEGAVTKMVADPSELSALFSFIANHNKILHAEVLVGHCMKWSRERDLLKRLAMPIVPTPSGLAFVPIDLQLPLEVQLSMADIMLIKATDEIIGVSEDSPAGVVFSEGFKKLESYLFKHPEIRVVDPTERVMPLVDRDATQEILRALPSMEVNDGGKFRAPCSIKVQYFDDPHLITEKMRSAGLVFPTIVKPQVACGASESHTMAVVFESDGFCGLPVPVPAMVQEYVDHGSIIYKFYVIGESIFYSKRVSTPDAAALRSQVSNNANNVLFDSLKSLPKGEMKDDGSKLDFEAMKKVGTLLRERLGLTIIGFDIVIQTQTHDHVIVDVNYFPTFKDVPDQETLPAFWNALKNVKHV